MMRCGLNGNGESHFVFTEWKLVLIKYFANMSILLCCQMWTVQRYSNDLIPLASVSHPPPKLTVQTAPGPQGEGSHGSGFSTQRCAWQM